MKLGAANYCQMANFMGRRRCMGLGFSARRRAGLKRCSRRVARYTSRLHFAVFEREPPAEEHHHHAADQHDDVSDDGEVAVDALRFAPLQVARNSGSQCEHPGDDAELQLGLVGHVVAEHG